MKEEHPMTTLSSYGDIPIADTTEKCEGIFSNTYNTMFKKETILVATNKTTNIFGTRDEIV